MTEECPHCGQPKKSKRILELEQFATELEHTENVCKQKSFLYRQKIIKSKVWKTYID